MNESQTSQLIKLASEMALGKNMPREFLVDWNLPASTSHGTLRKIEASAKDARAQCLEWSKRIMSVVNEDKR